MLRLKPRRHPSTTQSLSGPSHCHGRFDSAFSKCAGYLLSLDDQAARVEISILPERKLVILFGKHLIAGRGVDRPSSVQIRSLCWGRLSNEKNQQHQWIEGSHESLS